MREGFYSSDTGEARDEISCGLDEKKRLKRSNVDTVW